MIKSVSPKVSVCIPVYNGSDYIAESIESVMSQTYEDFELIISDNCSTDNTEEIVRSFHDPRLNYVKNTNNLGQTGNVNQCLNLAKGEYVCIIHHDDIMMPDNLEQKVNVLNENHNIGFVHSDIYLIGPKGEIISDHIWIEDSRHDYIKDGLTLLRNYISYMPYAASIFIGAVLARKTCYDKVGDFSPEIPNCDDSYMWMKMMLYYDVACIGKQLVKYRVHEESASSSWGDYTSVANLKEHFKATSMVFDNFRDKIPGANKLKREVYTTFGERAIGLASSAITNGDLATCKEFFLESLRYDPWMMKRKLFWKVAAGLLLGGKGVEQYMKLKGKGNR